MNVPMEDSIKHPLLPIHLEPPLGSSKTAPTRFVGSWNGGIRKPMDTQYFDGYGIFLGKTGSRYPHPVETAQTKVKAFPAFSVG